jgi:hypothetical protein
MSRMWSPKELETVVSDTIASIHPGVVAVSSDTALMGESAILDSIGLVTLLVTLEERLDGAVDLAASFLDQQNPESSDYPLRTVGALASHLSEQLMATRS